MANFSNTQTVTNLGTNTVLIPTTDMYQIQGTLTLPNVVSSATQGPGGGSGTGTGGTSVPSQVVLVVKQNGSTILTMPAGALGFSIPNLPCTAGDSITFTTSSSLSQDQQPNAIRLTLAISEGTL